MKNKLRQTLIFASASLASVVAVAQKQRNGAFAWSSSPEMIAESPLIPLQALVAFRLGAFIFVATISLKYTMAPKVTITWETLDGMRGIGEGA